MRFYICSGSLSTHNEIAEYYNYNPDLMLTDSGLRQQKDKLLHEGMHAVLADFTKKLRDLWTEIDGSSPWRYIFIDGTKISFPLYNGPDAELYRKNTRGASHSAVHCTAAYDANADLFTDMIIQLQKENTEHDAMVQLIARCDNLGRRLFS